MVDSPFAPFIPFDHPANMANEDGTLKIRTGVAELEAMLREDPNAHFYLTPDGRVVIRPEMTNMASQAEKTQPEMTFGERAVGLTFNPSGDPKVAKLKELYAEIIDICDESRQALMGGSEAHRLYAIAITEAQGAQMWAVKAATWKV